MRRLASLTIALTLIATACGSDSDETTLVIYSGRGEELIQPLIDDFEAATGIRVDVRYAGSTDLAATLLEEGSASDADVFLAQDPASLGSVADLLAELPNETLSKVDTRFRDRRGRWIGTSGRVRTFIYNKGTNIELPQTIDEVTNARWAGQVGIAPTNGSFLAFVAAMILERGEEATLDWLKALGANDPQDYPGNSPIVAATDNGEVEGGLVNHYYLLRLRAEGAGANAENWFIPSGDVGSLVMPAGVGILASSDVSDEAQQFVDFLLSMTAQTYFATQTFEFPMIEGVSSAPGLPPLSEISAPDIDLSRLAELLPVATRLVSEAGLV